MPTGKYSDPKTQERQLRRRERKETHFAKLRDDPEWWDAFVEKLSNHGRLKAHLDMEGIPWSTWSRWLKQNPEKQEQVQEALKGFAAAVVETMQTDIDAYDLQDPKFARLRSDTQQWLASRYNPAQYGDRSRVDVTITDKSAEHLEALRELSKTRRIKDVTPQPMTLEHHAEDQTKTDE